MTSQERARKGVVRVINQSIAINEAAWAALREIDLYERSKSDLDGILERLGTQIDEICPEVTE